MKLEKGKITITTRNTKIWLTCFLVALLSMPIASIAQSPKGRSYTYEGMIGSFPIHMTLFFRSDNSVVGSYYYDSQRARGNNDAIRLEGIYTGDVDNGKISLLEYGPSDKEIGSFNCELGGGHETDSDEGIMIIMHWISGGSGYRNYKSGTTYKVELECAEVTES